MNRKISFFLALLCAGLALPLSSYAQQVFVSNLDVKYVSGAANQYCNTLQAMNLGNNGSVAWDTSTGDVWARSSRIEYDRPMTTYPGNCLALCVQLICVSTTSSFGINELKFEVFEYKGGTNPLNESSAPPIKTVSLNNVGKCSSSGGAMYYVTDVEGVSNPNFRFCTAWDGTYNLNGLFGKGNGQFGFRAKVHTNEVSLTAGNISIDAEAAFPGQNQIPIQVDVTNIHRVVSSPTVVGRYAPVGAQPYNITYMLSKDAVATIKVYSADASGVVPLTSGNLVRTIVDGKPRVGEGMPDPGLTNGDFWDGRNQDGAVMPAGLYLVEIQAYSNDLWGHDDAFNYYFQMGLDPLQITDIGVKGLGAASTDVATISYVLTEAATAYVDVYPPGTAFDSVNVSPPLIGGVNRCDGNIGQPDLCLKHIVEQQEGRRTISAYWDGRDTGGNPVCDGDYMFALYGELASAEGAGGKILTSKTQVGTVPIARGLILTFIQPSSTVLGSSPAVAGLDPFYFRYTPTRDTFIDFNILPSTGGNPIRHLVQHEVRFANFVNREIWDGKDDFGNYVSSGAYLAELIAQDPYQCAAYSDTRSTVLFPVNMFRIVDVRSSPLLGGSTDIAEISYWLSQTMYVDLNIYPPSAKINPSLWPNPTSVPPIYTISGLRPGRFGINEPWDGKDKDELLVADGRYPFTIIAHSTDTTQAMYATDKAYGYVDVSRGQIVFTSFEIIPSIPTAVNSSETIKLPPYDIEYSMNRQSSVTITVMDLGLPPKTIRTVVAGGIRDGDTVYRDVWDGRDGQYNLVPGGPYNVRIVGLDIASQLSSMATIQQTIDVFPLRIYDVAITPLTPDNMATLSYQLSEPMKVVLQIFRPGTMFDEQGRPYPPASASLVKRVVGVRPMRTPISEYWDGTDLTFSKVPDGNYVFKVYASTMSEAISTIDGSIDAALCPSNWCLADDIVTSNIPVTKGVVEDLCGDFSRDTFFAPNPYTGASGWFKIPMPRTGSATLKLYNLAGDLVFRHDFGYKGAGDDIKYSWPKVNSYGRTVAGGVYLAVIRYSADATEYAGPEVCQAVKKILIP